MNEYEKLLAYLKIAYHNMTTLHRHLVKNEGWFCNHDRIGEWYGDIAEQLDDLAETGIALGYNEPSIKDAVLVFGNEALTVEPRELGATLKIAGAIIDRMAAMMQSAEAEAPASVVNKLQEYEYGWNKISHYMIAHAAGAKKTEEDDDE